jgi:ubiquinone/menaquinone biosynthesis C-methylase UbiE
MAAANRRSNAFAIRALEVNPTDTILELGAGPGTTIPALTTMAPQGCVLGIDHSQTMLAQAVRRNQRAIREHRVCLLRGRFDALPCRTESIDKILAVHVLYFMGATEIREARRVLRTHGTMAIVATDKFTMERLGFNAFETHCIFDQKDLITLAVSGGFARDEIAAFSIKLAIGITGLLAVMTKRGPLPANVQR